MAKGYPRNERPAVAVQARKTEMPLPHRLYPTKVI
jgi:hypothetical protein